jgi:hypothetical protein
MIEKAFVSGQIAQAIFKEDDKLFLIKAKDTENIMECTPYEKSLFFNSKLRRLTHKGRQAAYVKKEKVVEYPDAKKGVSFVKIRDPHDENKKGETDKPTTSKKQK